MPITIILDQTLPETVRFTWIQLRCLAWGRSETPILSILQIIKLLGKKQSAIYKHMAMLIDQGALRWRSAGCGTLIVSFPDHLQDSTTSNDCGVDGTNSMEIREANFPSTKMENNSINVEKPVFKLNQASTSIKEDNKNIRFHKNGTDSTSSNRGVFEENSQSSDEIRCTKSSKRLDEVQSPENHSQSHLPKHGVCEANSKALGEDQCMQTPRNGTQSLSLYKSLTKLTPNQPQRKLINTQVADLDRWRSSLEHWRSHGWSPRNVVGMLNLYTQGGPESCSYCHPKKAAPETPIEDYTEQRERDRIRVRKLIEDAQARTALEQNSSAQDQQISRHSERSEESQINSS